MTTYFARKGFALHGNVFQTEDLYKAQENPDEYSTLQVRVCGWNAYFVSLNKEEQDAYILGVNEPVKEFVGRIIAIIHRFDDVEEKWVVVPEDVSFTKDEIMKQVEFQEKYFKSEIRM